MLPGTAVADKVEDIDQAQLRGNIPDALGQGFFASFRPSFLAIFDAFIPNPPTVLQM